MEFLNHRVNHGNEDLNNKKVDEKEAEELEMIIQESDKTNY